MEQAAGRVLSISSLRGVRGPGNDAGRVTGSVCSSFSPWWVRSLELHVRQDFSVCSLWCYRKISCKFTCASTGAVQVHQCQHASWFDPTFQFVVDSNSDHQYFSSFFVAEDATRCRESSTSVVLLGTELAHAHDGSIDFAHMEFDPDLASVSQFHRGTDCSPQCFSLCPLAQTRWGFLLGSMATHSKSRGEHTCSSARLSTSPCTTYKSLEMRNGSLCRIAAKMYPVS